MADHETRRKANIGSSSLILIFIVLCLVTFCMLSLGNARREDVLAEKNAAAVQAYYQTDSKAVQFAAGVGQFLKNLPQSADATEVKAQVLKQFGDYYDGATDLIRTDITMDHGQALRVELKPDWEKRTYQVSTWSVYQKEDYEIDQSISVWTGEENT